MTDVTNLAAATGTGGSSGIFLYIVLGALVLMMFFGSRRARKQQREASAFRDSLEVGTEVMTGSGFFGTIVAVEGDRITLAAEDGGRTTWIRQAIAKVVEPVVEDDTLDVPEEDGTDTTVTSQDERPTND
ncbi:preprotein translocase subunit YajC [Flavimobilis sp. GY10621]|uniref:Preprotein translocase subunit YajC n=1 Tax=Flavimobilis rhizosphaerae TaxID=2775421 RepID=A0ABR9DTA8_9MICO|nr:preprotein translocase subunit YajC [Flavimobilis rhizosphaerae]MBD9700352.1 preprotein translocase subunit YajC [Flavimobilis rhizosphaerae]